MVQHSSYVYSVHTTHIQAHEHRSTVQSVQLRVCLPYIAEAFVVDAITSIEIALTTQSEQ